MKEVRKLQERRIRRDYFTFPSVKKKEVVNKILEAVPQAKGHLQDVPGFFYDTQKKEITYSGYKGIGILIRDAYSKVVAVQIRRDKIKEGDNRYVWFSSSFALYDAEGKCTGGNGTGSPKDVTVPQKVKMAYSIAITEGRFKAEKLAENGQFAISLQGVGSWSRIDETISDIKKRCAEKRIGMYKTIYIFYDSDMLGNTAVFDQAIKLGKYVESKFKDMRIMYCVWDMENGKGIDDLILNGKTENIRYICRTDLEEKHEKVLNDLLASVGCSKIVEVEKKCGKKAAVLFAFKLQKNMQELLHS